MNQLDNEIRRAFDELVNAAPPPPAAPSPIVPLRTDEDPPNIRLLAVAASILLVVVGVFAFLQQNDRPESMATSDASDAPGSSEPTATPMPVQTEPTLISEESGGSPDPVTSVELAPVEEYETVPTPMMPGATEPVPNQGGAYDGVYFAFLHEGPVPDDPRALRFDTVQAFSGQDCLERFGSDAADACTPFGIDVEGPTGQLDLSVDGIAVTLRDLNSDSSYRVSGDELLANVFGQPLAPSAPDSYAFSGGFGFLLTFDDGVLTRIDQPGDPQPAGELSGWSPTSEPFSDLTYIACCGIDWTGLPSPLMPADPTDELVAGTYNVRQVASDDPLDGVLSLELRAYVRCDQLGDRGTCNGSEPHADDALGVADEPDRVIDLDLDTIDVAVSSSECAAGALTVDNQVARGSDLVALYLGLDADYRATVIDQLDAGVTPTDIRASLTAEAGPGFFDPGCPSWSSFWWAPTSGPTVITPFVADLDSPIEWRAVNIWQTMIPTALVIDEQGNTKLHLTTGFLS